MAGTKKVQVGMTLGPKFGMESKIRDHVIRVDQPRTSGGDDTGPTPLEYLLVSLAGCIGTVGRIIANQRHFPLRSMDVQIEGDLDTEVLLGKKKEPRSGFIGIRALVKIDADMSAEEKRKLLHEIDERCPISDNIANATPVSVELVE